jgi:fumarate hydratase class I
MDIGRIAEDAFRKTTYNSIALAAEAPSIRSDRLVLSPGLLRALSKEAFRSLSFYLRRTHLERLADALEDTGASENDRLVIEALLRNAVIASGGSLPLCQDTGTAMVMAWKDESVRTGTDDQEELSEGIVDAYTRYNLRSSQTGASSFFGEFDTLDNSPAQIHLHASKDSLDGPSYRFLFVAKGGGSANKTSLFQMSKTLLEEAPFENFLREKIAALGTAACPPYRLAVVVGGTSPEENLLTLKLATTELLDGAESFQESGAADREPRRIWLRRDAGWEARLMRIARESGLGAQFGGVNLALDARVIRLPRHAGSCPVSIGVSCSAHRNLLAVVDARGVRMEALEEKPLDFLAERGGRSARLAESIAESKKKKRSMPDAAVPAPPDGGMRRIDLDRPMQDILGQLEGIGVGSRMLLSGRLLVARDAAHLAWRALIARGKPLPAYLTEHPIYYAGPAATPPGKVIGSFGPTTAQRMDGYAQELMSRGVALVTLAKGNRAQAWTDGCRTYGGFYLGTIGGAAALIAEENITESEVLDYPELGMEAVRRIRVRDLIAIMIADNRGNDLYSQKTQAGKP